MVTIIIIKAVPLAKEINQENDKQIQQKPTKLTNVFQIVTCTLFIDTLSNNMDSADIVYQHLQNKLFRS
jgi:hypothetical protein